MEFVCVDRKRSESWPGFIRYLKNHGSHWELQIQSRSSLHVMLGKCINGMFASIPDYNAGCYLSTPNDLFYNTERLSRAMKNKVDGLTVATAIKAIREQLTD